MMYEVEKNDVNYGAYKIDNFADLEEYIENREEVIKMLDRVNFSIKGVGTNGNGYKYIFEMFTNSKVVEFEYTEGIGCKVLSQENGLNKIINALWCILSDYFCVADNSLVGFMREFGYEDLEQGEKIYNDILENNKKLLEIFTESEIEFLKDNIQL